MAGLVQPLNQQLPAVTDGSTISSLEQLQRSTTASATDSNTSSELVSLLQELGPDEIVSMLRQKGIKVQANKQGFNSERTINQSNESHNVNVGVTSSEGVDDSYGNYSISSGTPSKSAARVQEGASNTPKVKEYKFDIKNCL